MKALSVTQSAQLAAAIHASKWNSVIPKSAVSVEEDGDNIKYLHPTKGWRWVHKRRLGMQA